MTPTPKHIEEARRFADHICLDTERDAVVQKIATLLAAQEDVFTWKSHYNHMREERDDAFQRGYESAEALRKQLIEAQARNSKLLAVVDAARTSRQMHQETRSLELLDAALSTLETDNTKPK